MKYLFLVFIVAPIVSFSQNNIVRLEGSDHLDIWKPYLEETSNFQDSTDALKSHTYTIRLNTEIRTNNNWWFSIGLAFKQISYRAEDIIKSWKYTYYSGGQGMIISQSYTYFYDDPPDLVARSDNFGMHLESNYQLTDGPKWNTSVGLATDLYLFEMYRSWYESEDFKNFSYYEEGHPKPVRSNFNSFKFSSANFNFHYRIRRQLSDRFNAGLKLSLGANIYSDWTHFSKNAWLGMGLEFGFGRKLND